MSRNRRTSSVPVAVIVLFVLILAVVPFVMWMLGYTPFIRVMVPFATALSLVLLAVTAVLIAASGFRRVFGSHCDDSLTCCMLRKFSPSVLVSSGISLVIGMTVIALAYTFPGIGKLILAVIGAIAFAIMLITFISMIISIITRSE